MRVIVTSLALVLGAGLGAGAAFAQTGSTTPSPAANPPSSAAPAKSGSVVPNKKAPVRTGKNAVDDGIAECMQLWDAGTHMSKQEWSSTCKRIQSRLENLKIENLDVMGTGVRKKGTAGRPG